MRVLSRRPLKVCVNYFCQALNQTYNEFVIKKKIKQINKHQNKNIVATDASRPRTWGFQPKPDDRRTIPRPRRPPPGRAPSAKSTNRRRQQRGVAWQPLAGNNGQQEENKFQIIARMSLVVLRNFCSAASSHLYRLQGFHVQDVVGVIQGRFLVVEGREAHSLEVTSVALFATHHDPHCSEKTVPFVP